MINDYVILEQSSVVYILSETREGKTKVYKNLYDKITFEIRDRETVGEREKTKKTLVRQLER